jgi:mono/diheme cytochrome c family protein
MGALPLAFLAVWVVLALVLVVLAMYGSARQARERMLHAQSRRGRHVTALVIVGVIVVMGIAVPALVVASNESDNRAGAARTQLTPAQERGRELFGQSCNQCHVLAAANTVGKVGPDLDRLKPNKATTLDAIDKGRVRGAGTMPADILQGQDAEDVAEFVAAVAGKQ